MKLSIYEFHLTVIDFILIFQVFYEFNSLLKIGKRVYTFAWDP